MNGSWIKTKNIQINSKPFNLLRYYLNFAKTSQSGFSINTTLTTVTNTKLAWKQSPFKNTTFFTLPTWKGPELLQLKHNMDVRRKTQKRHLWHNIKRGHFLTFWLGWSQRWPLWSAAIGVVSVENSLCSIILMAVSNCIMSEQQVALAAGVAALTASPHWPRGSGQG